MDKGLAEADKIEKEFQLPVPNRLELASLRAAAYFTLNQFDKAEQILQKARATYPNELTVNQALFELYQEGEISYEDALRFADSQNEVRLKIKLAQGGDARSLSQGMDGVEISEVR